MSRRKTIEEFKQGVYNLVGNEYTVKSNTYVNAHTKLLIRHNKCGYEWKVTPFSLIKDNVVLFVLKILRIMLRD